MCDFWPVESLWSIIKADVAQKAIFDLKGLKKAIINSWKKVIIEKELCQT